MMRNEAGTDSARDGGKAKGSDSVSSESENQPSGNGLVSEFSNLTDPKVMAPGGGGDKPDVVAAVSPESGSGVLADAGLVGIQKPIASSMDSGNNSNGAKADGSVKKLPAGEFGYKTNGVSGAFPSSTELLKGF